MDSKKTLAEVGEDIEKVLKSDEPIKPKHPIVIRLMKGDTDNFFSIVAKCIKIAKKEKVSPDVIEQFGFDVLMSYIYGFDTKKIMRMYFDVRFPKK